MNKEKLKKVFSFIGKLFLLVILTYSAVASTIGCFNSLKKNINDSPDKVHEVKRANLDKPIIVELFNGFYSSGDDYNIFSMYYDSIDGFSYPRFFNQYYKSDIFFYLNYSFDIGVDYHFSCYVLMDTNRYQNRFNGIFINSTDINISNWNNVSSYGNSLDSVYLSVDGEFTDYGTNYTRLLLDYYFTADYNTLSFLVHMSSNSQIYFINPSLTLYGNDIDDAYNNGYSLGYSDGYDVGNSDGFDNGYSAGEGYVLSHPLDFDLYPQEEYDSAYYDGYNVGVMESYDVGYNAGYGAGATDVVNRELAENGFIKLANIVFNAPYNILHNTFNFEFLGINLWALMSFVFTIALVFGVIGFFKRR